MTLVSSHLLVWSSFLLFSFVSVLSAPQPPLLILFPWWRQVWDYPLRSSFIPLHFGPRHALGRPPRTHREAKPKILPQRMRRICDMHWGKRAFRLGVRKWLGHYRQDRQAESDMSRAEVLLVSLRLRLSAGVSMGIWNFRYQDGRQQARAEFLVDKLYFWLPGFRMLGCCHFLSRACNSS